MSDSTSFRKRKPLSGITKRHSKQEKIQECEKPGESSVKWILIAVFAGGLWVLVVLPSPIEPEPFSLPPPPKFEDELKPNTRLQDVTKILENKLRGPESIAIRNGKLYTGTADGKIICIETDSTGAYVMKTVARLGVAPCGKPDDEDTCGRPLGMRFDKDGTLVVADAYLGLFKINVETGRYVRLLSPLVDIAGKSITFLNDLDIAEDGVIYVTESSTKWPFKDNRFLIMDAPHDGRVIKYNQKTREVSVVIDHLMFPNGIQVSHNGDYLLVVELTRCRILKYNLKGLNSGRIEVFADNLPGVPDNIRLRPNGGYWVGMATTRSDDRFSFIDVTASRPWIKKFLMKVFDPETLVKLSPRYGLIIELDQHGKIRRSLHDPTGKNVPSVSQVTEENGVLYLGSYFLPYISKLILNDTEMPDKNDKDNV